MSRWGTGVVACQALLIVLQSGAGKNGDLIGNKVGVSLKYILKIHFPLSHDSSIFFEIVN